MKALTKLVVIALGPTLAVGNLLCAAVMASTTLDMALGRIFSQTAALLFFAVTVRHGASTTDEASHPAMVLRAAAYSFVGIALLTFGTVVLADLPLIRAGEWIFFEALAVGIMAYVLRRGLRTLPPMDPDGFRRAKERMAQSHE